MSSVGSPTIGDSPGFSVDTSVATEIPRYSVVSAMSDANMTVSLCDASSTDSRDRACAIAQVSWPSVPQVYGYGEDTVSDISNYDSERKMKLAGKQEGYSWILVSIPSGGNDVALAPGDKLVPSIQTDGGVEPLEATSLTASYASATIIADIEKERRVIAIAYSLIHVPTGNDAPRLGGGTVTNSLTALTNAVTYGYVFGKLTLG